MVLIVTFIDVTHDIYICNVHMYMNMYIYAYNIMYLYIQKIKTYKLARSQKVCMKLRNFQV